jgi:hypothetical protein
LIIKFEQPEQALVAACLSPDVALQSRRDELIQSGVNWDNLLVLASRHGVQPLLFRGLEAAPKGSVPQAVLVKLYAFYRQNASHNLRHAGELHAVVEQFEKHNIPVLAMKGPVLAMQAYGALSLRQFGDLDILIHPQDFRLAYELLTHMGYHLVYPLTSELEARLLRTEIELQFRSSNNSFVELHWAVSHRRDMVPLPASFFWQAPVSVQLPGGSVTTFAPERALLALCIHSAKHEWGSWKWIADIAHLCAAYPNIDWAAVVEQYARYGFRDVTCLGFALVEALTGYPAAPGLESLMRTSRLEQIVLRTLLEARKVPPWADMIHVRYYAQLRERWRERLLYWLDKLIQPGWSERKIARLPEPVYYVIRPFRLLATRLGRIFQKLWGWVSKANLQ